MFFRQYILTVCVYICIYIIIIIMKSYNGPVGDDRVDQNVYEKLWAKCCLFWDHMPWLLYMCMFAIEGDSLLTIFRIELHELWPNMLISLIGKTNICQFLYLWAPRANQSSPTKNMCIWIYIYAHTHTHAMVHQCIYD